MKKGIGLIVCLVIINLNLFSQKGKTAKDSSRRYLPVPLITAGYLWEGYNNIEIGIKPTWLISRKGKIRGHENISLIFGGDIYKNNVTYVSPFATVKYYYTGIKYVNLHFSVCYWQTTFEGVTDQRITPEIDIGEALFSLSYGYNISISSEQIPFITTHRIALRFTCW